MAASLGRIQAPLLFRAPTAQRRAANGGHGCSGALEATNIICSLHDCVPAMRVSTRVACFLTLFLLRRPRSISIGATRSRPDIPDLERGDAA